MQKPRAVFCWSGGKDSALALYRVLRKNQFEVIALLTTLNEQYQRISMHGVREALLDIQADSMGLRLEKVWVKEGSNAEYERRMEEKLVLLKKEGVTHMLFGDIFLEDLRLYRENNLSRIGLQAVFPLWKEDSMLLLTEFLQEGFETITCCINSQFLDESFAGKKIDKNFIHRLPPHVDPCGENGEFHTFCYKGPIFKKEIQINIGETINRDEYWFTDLL